MLFDAHNIFLDNEDITATPKVVENGEGGSAYNPAFLVAKFAEPVSADATITIKTGDKENGSDASAIGSLIVKKGEKSGAVKLPFGGKKYYSIAVAGPTSGKATIALTLDADLA